MPPEPLISIVTPCFNAANFIERTILSVLSQDYPKIEYIVQDAASKDGTVAILERYASRLRYTSETGRRGRRAPSQGFRTVTRRNVAWDRRGRRVLTRAPSKRQCGAPPNTPDAGVLYGEATWVNKEGQDIGRYPTGAPYRRRCSGRSAAF